MEEVKRKLLKKKNSIYCNDNTVAITYYNEYVVVINV